MVRSLKNKFTVLIDDGLPNFPIGYIYNFFRIVFKIRGLLEAYRELFGFVGPGNKDFEAIIQNKANFSVYFVPPEKPLAGYK